MKPRDGILVPEGSIELLKIGMLRLAKDAELRQILSDNAQKRALSDFDLLKNEENLEKHYLNAIDNQNFLKRNTAN